MPDYTLIDPLKSNHQRVNANNEALTSATTRTPFLSALIRGESFDVEINTIAVTVATNVGLIYIKNTNTTEVLYLDHLFFEYGDSTNGVSTQDFITLNMVANPTTGTLITAGTALTPFNRLIGSAAPATGTFLGNTGIQTITNGTTGYTIQLTSNSAVAGTFNTAIDIALMPNQAWACTYDGLASNTSQNISFGVKFHYEALDQFKGA